VSAKPESVILTVVRCGDTAWDAEGRLRGRNNLPLSEEGRGAVRRDAAALAGRKFAAVHHPPDDAAAETARIVAEVTGARCREVDDLADADLGVLVGMQEQEFAERFAKRFKQWQEDPVLLAPPEGESIAAARARIFEALARLLRRSRYDETAVVLHPLGLGLLRCWLAGRPSSDLRAVAAACPRVERYALGAELLDRLGEVTGDPGPFPT
jgi:probable phosphoglycerate mutase